MLIVKWFICWMFGHTPSEKVLDVDTVLGGMYIAYCVNCGCTISYDDNLNGWVKW